MSIEPGQEYVACDRSGHRYRIDSYQHNAPYVQMTDLADGRHRKVKRENLHADPRRRTGYLLASEIDAEWRSHPLMTTAIYQAQFKKISDRATEQ
ncbi:hypothetical protein [Streptomyces sp. NPDC048612]|uniref:hypothetical protein n=1 Tax=Streptomyces sp. NPDC048612 TaxID=3365579 RepID=UPI0037208CFC